MRCFHGSANLGAALCIRSTGRDAEAKETETRNAMKEATSDPRQPSTAKPYVSPTLSPQDLPIDYAGFLAVVFGVVGVTLRVWNHGIGYKLFGAFTTGEKAALISSNIPHNHPSFIM